jgi:hypothetical protein
MLVASGMSIRAQCVPAANTARAPLSTIIAATASSLTETFSGTTETPARPAPNSVASISRPLPISTAARSPGASPSAASPFATRQVARSNSAQFQRRSPQITATLPPCQRPCWAIRSGISGRGTS